METTSGSRFCGNCGASRVSSQHFCERCGHGLENIRAESNTSAAEEKRIQFHARIQKDRGEMEDCILSWTAASANLSISFPQRTKGSVDLLDYNAMTNPARVGDRGAAFFLKGDIASSGVPNTLLNIQFDSWNECAEFLSTFQKPPERLDSDGKSAYGSVGMFLLLAGIAVTCYFFLFFSTAIETNTSFGPVENIGLLSERSNGITIGLALCVVGVILLVASSVLASKVPDEKAAGGKRHLMLQPCPQGFDGQHRWAPDAANANREVCVMHECSASRERQY